MTGFTVIFRPSFGFMGSLTTSACTLSYTTLAAPADAAAAAAIAGACQGKRDI
jgi:hypothetical protein